MSDNPWDNLDIPEAWTYNAKLRALVAEHLGPDKAPDAVLDIDTTTLMSSLVILAHVELASKVSDLTRTVQNLIEALRESVQG